MSNTGELQGLFNQAVIDHASIQELSLVQDRDSRGKARKEMCDIAQKYGYVASIGSPYLVRACLRAVRERMLELHEEILSLGLVSDE